MAEDRDKKYEREREAFQNLKRDIVKHGNGHVTDRQADDMARTAAKKSEELKGKQPRKPG